MIKSFRRSKRSSNSSPSPKKAISRIGSTSSSRDLDESNDAVLQSPKKVIKALYDYIPQGPGELPFKQGDFFHVINDDQERIGQSEELNGWYEATNPMTNARGMVPVLYFEVFNRSRPIQTPSAPTHIIDTNKSPNSSNHQRNSLQTLYAVTLYEFKAERDDELDIMPGENLIICAHHDFEWFIAKPINRLGGPGLVPASYVKIIDLVNPNNAHTMDEDIIKVINKLKIPTVEQWKDQTARYQASTIPLGSISNNGPAVTSSNTQYFQKDPQSDGDSYRSSLSLTNTKILEVCVDSYLLDHGRYQYHVIARLDNGKIRYLYRYYQHFYDVQVKLLELFPYEAGKIENSKRIIPSIPGPLIHVNENISKMRREKLDYYLQNLVALPPHISRSETVLQLFEVLDNGYDKEIIESPKNRTSKPISQKSNYQQDRLSQYSGILQNSNNRSSSTPNSSDSALNRISSSSSNNNNINSINAAGGLAAPVTTSPANPHPSAPPPPTENKQPKVKVKFYYEDDIFVLLLPTNLRLQDLKSKLAKRLDLPNNEDSPYGGSGEDNTTEDYVMVENGLKSFKNVQLFLKNDYDDFVEENGLENTDSFNDIHKEKLREFEIFNDERFHESLYDKCKIVILAQN